MGCSEISIPKWSCCCGAKSEVYCKCNLISHKYPKQIKIEAEPIIQTSLKFIQVKKVNR